MNDIEKKANKIAQSRPENGKEFEQMQSAQNQLLGIQATQKQNLMEQRLAESNLASQNEVMRQAAELSAMGGNMNVNQATQGVMGRYGLNKPMTTSSSKQIRTPQGIIINNNTTNITNVPANIGGPLQGRPIQFKAGDSAGESSKFKDWISKAFDRQNEEAKKREREYARRETSLTKSSNKIMRKLEEFSKDITRKLDPRNIGTSVSGQIGTILRLFGIGYIAGNTEKILDGIKKFVDGGKELFSWIKGDSKETPRFIKNITDSFSNAFGKVIFGDDYKSTGNNGILWGLWNSKGTGVINQFFNSLLEKFRERADYAKSIIKFPDKLEKDNLPQNIGALLDSITSYLSILIGGEKAVGRSFEKELKTQGDNLRDGKDLKRQANAVHGSSSRVAYINKEDMTMSASAAMQNGWVQLENGDWIHSGATPWSRGASSYISATGQEKAKYLLPNHTDSKGRLIGTDVSQVAAVSDLANAYANKNKSGAGMQMLNDLRTLNQFSGTRDLPIIADPKDIATILGVNESEIKTSPHLVTVRDKLVSERYPGAQVLSNMAASRALTGKIVEGGWGVLAGAGALAGVVALIPGVNAAVGIIGLGCWIAGSILKKVPAAEIGVGTAVLSAGTLTERANAKDLQEGIVRMDPFSMKQYWTIYGDYRIPLTEKGYRDSFDKKGRLKELGLVIDELQDEGVSVKYRLVRIMPNYENFEKIVKSGHVEGDIFIVNLRDNIRSLFNDRYLDNVIEAAKEGYIVCTNMAEISDETLQKINDTISGQEGFTPVLSSENAENIAIMAKNIGGKGGQELLDFSGRMVEAAGQASWTDSMIGLDEAKLPETGERKGMTTLRGEARAQLEANNGNVSWNTNGASNVAGGGAFNIQAAVNHLVGHAKSSPPPPGEGECAKYVRKAMEAGGLNTDDRPGHAGDYGNWLLTHGWEEVTDGSLKAGDVEVYQKTNKHQYGHLQMWSGEGWYSDFAQKDKSGEAYANRDGGKRTRYRYVGSNGSNIKPTVSIGSLGLLPGLEDTKSDDVTGGSGSFWDTIKGTVNKIWDNALEVVDERREGVVNAVDWMNGGRNPVNMNTRPLSGVTKDIIKKYTNANYTGGALSYLKNYGISPTDVSSRKVLSSLFDEEGKLKVDTAKLDPELVNSLRNIEGELKKGNEIDIKQLEVSAAGIDSTLSASQAQSVATQAAIAGLGGRKSYSPSVTSDLQ